jgi:glycosyltransferase involved in cell wall biosynthesis
MPAMHVLFLADTVAQDNAGGSRTVAHETARELVALGHQATFLVGQQRAELPFDEHLDGYRVLRHPGTPYGKEYQAEGARVAEELLQKEKIDIVYTQLAHAAPGPLTVLKNIPHVRIFYGPCHEEYRVEERAKLAQRRGFSKLKQTLKIRREYREKRDVERGNVLAAQKVIVLSQHSAQEVIELGYPNENIVVIPAGADIHRFTVGDKQASRTHLHLPSDAPILFTIRRLVPRMGLDNLITAMQEVVQKYPNALLLIGGTGILKENLEEQVRRLNLTQNVRLLGFVPDEDMLHYYRAATLFVLPTIALEGFGLVTVEALACGTPALGTPIGGTVEILGKLDKAFLTHDATPTALRDGLLQFLARPPAYSPQQLRAFVEENFTWRKHTEGVIEVFNELKGQVRSA